MKVLLVAPRDDVALPVGMAYIAASLKAAGHDVDCCYFSGGDDLLGKLEKGYDLMGTGGMSLHFKQIKDIILIAQATKTRVVVGGNIITSEPELLTGVLGADYGVIGQGEETIVELLTTLEDSGELRAINGICYFSKNEFIVTETRKPSCDLDSLPWPDWDSFELRKTLDAMKPTDSIFFDVFDNPRQYNIVTARSCPFSCTFCYHPHGEKYRQRSIDSVMAELKTVIPKYKINIVSLQDDLFSANKDRVYEFCMKFREFAENVPWDMRWLCQMRVDSVDASMLDEMRESGCYILSYGFESFSAQVLKSMKKRTTPEQIKHAIETTLENRISIQGNFIFGDVAETIQTAKETLEFWADHIEAMIGLVFIRVYPDSEIYRYCIKKGIIKDRLDHISNHLFDILNMTEMSDREFRRLMSMVEQYRERIAAYNRIIPSKMSRDSVTIRCPYCNQVSEFRNYRTGFLFKAHMFCRHCRRRIFVCSRIWDMAFIPFFIPLRRLLKHLKNRLTRSENL